MRLLLVWTPLNYDWSNSVSIITAERSVASTTTDTSGDVLDSSAVKRAASSHVYAYRRQGPLRYNRQDIGQGHGHSPYFRPHSVSIISATDLGSVASTTTDTSGDVVKSKTPSTANVVPETTTGMTPFNYDWSNSVSIISAAESVASTTTDTSGDVVDSSAVETTGSSDKCAYRPQGPLRHNRQDTGQKPHHSTCFRPHTSLSRLSMVGRQPPILTEKPKPQSQLRSGEKTPLAIHFLVTLSPLFLQLQK